MAERTCQKCGKEFQYPSLLQRHRSRTTPCDPIIEPDQRGHGPSCKYCGRSFTTPQAASRHMRHRCKIANSEEGMGQLMEHTLQKQVVALQAQMAAQSAAMAEMAGMVRQLVGSVSAPVAVTQHVGTINAGPVTTQIDARTTNIQVNVVGFDREDRIHIPVALVKAAFTENPRLIEYCRMSDDERTDADKAAPYVLEALLDLVRRAHRDPVYRNVYLNPQRADQVMVCLDEERVQPAFPRGKAQSWEIRSLIEAIRLLFDGVADNLHKIIITDQERRQLPFDVQSAASWVPNLYEDEPDRFVKDGRVPMAAHLQNTRPDEGGKKTI